MSLCLLMLVLAAAPAEPKLSWSMSGFCHRPVWSPGGEQLVCSGPSKTGHKYQVYERGAVLWELHGKDPAWSPDGKRLVSLLDAHSQELALAIWEAGAVVGQLRGRAPTSAAWSPDGKAIVFSTGSFDHSELASTATADPWTKERIEELMIRCRAAPACIEKELPTVQPLGPGNKPAFSRDGHLAFVRYDKKAGFELAVLRSGAKEPVAVPGASIFQPVWSPDGRSIAAVGSCGGSSCVYVVELENLGKGLRRLAESSGADLAWSPDGASIAFLRRLPADGPPPRPGPTGHLPEQLKRDALARVNVATGHQSDILVPATPCSLQSVAWSRGGLFTHHRCYPPGAPPGGDTQARVYDVK